MEWNIRFQRANDLERVYSYTVLCSVEEGLEMRVGRISKNSTIVCKLNKTNSDCVS